MATNDLHTLLPAFVSLPEHLGNLCTMQFLAPPVQLLLGGLLGEGEASQLLLHPSPTHQQWEHCLRWSRICGDHLTDSHLLLLHLLVRQIGHPSEKSLGALQVLWRVVRIILVDMQWAWTSFLALSRQSFSTSVAISTIKSCIEVLLIHRHHRLFPLLCLLIIAYICILVKAYSW